MAIVDVEKVLNVKDDGKLATLDSGATVMCVPNHGNLIGILRARLIGLEPAADQCWRARFPTPQIPVRRTAK